ncbi:MAG: T9SS type A sorting domain-containing protein [bacterium]|nr:T9SS type A sorting domain-containing protein [bacterium]
MMLPLFFLSISVLQAQITVDFQVTEPACFGQPNGSVTATATGGNAPYSYTWNTGAVGPVLSGITAGTYTVTVVDASNNSAIKNVTVTQPELVNVDITADNCTLPITITATGSGGEPPYNYNWNTGQNGSTITVPGAGTYCVTMTDQDLCGAVECITVDFTPLDVNVNVNNITCPGDNDGQITATPIGGTPPFTYLWNTGAVTSSISGLSPGTYTVTVTDSEGCQAVGSGTVIEPPALFANATGQNPVCVGDDNGSASVVASGGTLPYSYLWSTGATTTSIAGLAPGGYSVTVTDANGCTAVDNVVIAPLSNLNVSLQKNDESCPDQNDGSITAFPVGGVQPVSYSWSNGAATQTISGLAPGVYAVTVTDAQGCQDVASTIIMAASDLEITTIANDVTVCDGANGSATVSVTDGAGPFTYQWSTGATTQTISNLPGGIYMVTVTDVNGCTATDGVVIDTPPNLIVSIITSESTVCLGENTSTATATVSGGTAPFTYLWSTGETTQQIMGLGAGTYTVTVTDAAQCQDVATVVIEAAPSLGLTISGDETVCDPEGEGFATATPIGGTPPFTYNWSNGSTTASIGNLPEGTYTVTVTDALGCTAIESIDIEIVDDFILDIIVTNPLCPEDENGSILAEGWGGTPPYIYQWSNGVTGTPLLENIGAGNYSVTVTDQNGCQLIENFTLVDPPAVVADISATQELCPGETTGMAMAMASGGTPPYTYLWNTGATTQMITGLSAGTYTVTVTDANGCEDLAAVVIEEASALVVVISGDETICDPEGEGLATAMASGGNPPYTYQWSTGATTQAIANLPEGSYSVTVTDALGCTAVDEIDIDIVDDFILDIIVTNPLCPGDENGSILAEGWGGTPPYIYQWSNGVTGTPLLENIGAGNYSVTVTDQNGCQLIENFVLTDPPTLVATINATVDVCPGEFTGTAMAVGMGGTPPYTYEWSTGATTQMITGLGAGTYTVTITDANGCQAAKSVEIGEYDGVTAVITGTDIVCGAETDGMLTAMSTSGTPPFTYVWSTGATTQTIMNLGAGTYSVTVTDANGCTDDTSFTIDVSDDLAVNGTSKNLLCFGDGTGEATANPTGGTPPYTYQWNNGSMAPAILNVPAGFYSVTVTDDNGCTASQTFVISQPTEIEVDANAGGLVCPGEMNGTAMAMASGGTPPYSYEWSTGATTQMITGLGAGTYTVTVTDANECEATAMVTIVEAPELDINVDAPEVVCGAGNTGEASVEATGGLPPYTYEWSTGESDTNIENLPEGTYSVTVTDANGCTKVEEIFIEVIEDFSITVVPRDVLCNGDNTGSILVTAEGGTAPYSYEWSTGDTLSELINLPAGQYSLTVTDANDCTLSETVTIGEPPLLELDLDVTDVTCANAGDGQVIINVSGGNDASYTIFVDGTEVASNTITGLSGPDTLIVTVRDANFCETSDTAIINEPEAIELSLDVQNNPCNGDMLGAVMTTVSGGNMPYNFEWSNGATTPDIMGVPAGTYSVTVTDIEGCTATAEATVAEPDPISITLNKTDIFCDDDGTGSITAVVTGGTPAYTYEWSNGETTATIDGLQPGQYTVTVTDLNECTAMASVTIDAFPSLSLTPIATSPQCFGESTGAAAVSVSGGTPPFSYQWNTGSTTPELINLPAGIYEVTVTDDAGCTGTAIVGVAQPEELIASISSSMTEDVSCNGLSDGQASVEVTGGTMPFTYEWSNGQTTPTATNLSAGTYTVTVTDANDCEDILTVEINEPEAIDLNITADVGNTCENTSDGAVSVSAMGGTPPFFYEWSNGATTPSISNLPAGTYTVTVTDIAACTATASIDVNAFPAPSCSIEVTNPISTAGNDGEATITVTGGTAPYTYLWSDGQTTQTATGLASGDYTATVTDANGCETTCMVTVAPPAQLGDYVWLDEDRDGIQDPNEQGIEGVMVILQIPAENDPINVDTMFTDANGFYLFNVDPGEYKVQFIAPGGLVFTAPNQGVDDALDSDADTLMGMTGIYVINAGDSNLTVDAGLYTKCDNIDDPGLIGPNQFLCGPGNDPDPIINIESPSGGSGAIEYLWMQSTVAGPFNLQTWQIIPGATGDSYDPGPLSETTYFARCARRECCIVYLESNIVTIEVGNVAVADINGPDFICVDEPTTFFAGPTGANAQISWSMSPGLSPQSATGPQVNITASSHGSFTITLQVTENGCTSTDIETITGTNSPIYCGSPMPLTAEVTNEVDGEVMVSWMTEEFIQDHTYTVEHSADGGERFVEIATVEEPSAYLGVMNYYEQMHEDAKRGRNLYRLRIENPQGDIFYSEEAEAILYGDSEIALLYPNPAEEVATLELFETFGESVTVELLGVQGNVIYAQQLAPDAQQLELDVKQLPSGTYFVKLNYSKSGVKVLKLTKK